MSPIAAVTVFVLVGLLLYAIALYNGLVRLRHVCHQSWSNIDVLLRQRYDEIPKLVDVCKAYMLHEANTLERVMKARSAAAQGATEDVAGTAVVQASVAQALHQLFAVVENYPELHSNKNFLGLQARISSIEDQIADRRELYNAATNNHNTRLEQFPDLVVALLFRFRQRALWETEPATREDPEVDFS